MEELLKEVTTWMIDHPNRYSKDRYEDAYWTMLNLRDILDDNPNEKTIEACKAIFKRNRFIY
jgi:hypothetical protein